MTEASSGLKQNVAGILCYVFWWIGAIVMLVLEADNKYVKFHAFQSIIVNVGTGTTGDVPVATVKALASF